jgi:hypothetical protein
MGISCHVVGGCERVRRKVNGTGRRILYWSIALGAFGMRLHDLQRGVSNSIPAEEQAPQIWGLERRDPVSPAAARFWVTAVTSDHELAGAGVEVLEISPSGETESRKPGRRVDLQ